jgi:Na+/phosphate symporter
MGEAIVHETQMSETIVHEAPAVTDVASSASLLNREESELLHTRWNEIQGKFVDEPRAAVEQADELVTEVIELITEMFNNEHRSLEAQWNKGNDVSTEDLRKALQRYRSFIRLVV